MNKNLNRRTFLGILGGLIAGAVSGFKVNTSPVIDEPLESANTNDTLMGIPIEYTDDLPDIENDIILVDYKTYFLTTKKLAVECRVSDELLADSMFDLENYIRHELANKAAMEMDDIIINGYHGESPIIPVGIIGVL